MRADSDYEVTRIDRRLSYRSCGADYDLDLTIDSKATLLVLEDLSLVLLDLLLSLAQRSYQLI